MTSRPDRRATNTALAVLSAAGAMGAVCGSASAQPFTVDAFDAGVNGWGIYNDGENLTFEALQGNPGGCIRAADGSSGTWWGFTARPAYTGNKSCLYGGVLTWQLRTNFTGGGTTQPDVFLSGNGLTLVYDTPMPIANTWATNTVTLSETAGWRITSLTGAVPTQAQFQGVLANITDLRLRGEFSTNNSDAAFLDNVAMASFLISSPGSLAVCSGTNVALTVTVTAGAGNGPISFLWHMGGTPVDTIANPSAATGTLLLNSIQPGEAGTYQCVVSNACGHLTSRPAQVFVDASDFGVTGGVPGRDGVYDNNDFVVFINDFFNASPSADLGSTGGVLGSDGAFDNNDFVVFIDQFFTGAAGC